jgi:hypothetical protein
MPRRLIAVALIFIGASIAWFVLGGTLQQRTQDSDSSQRSRLSTQWGSPQTQQAPIVVTSAPVATEVPIQSSRIDVQLNLEQRRKGLLWYNLYDVQFFGRYVMRNDTKNSHLVLRFPLPADGASYVDLVYRIGDRLIDNAVAVDRKSVSFELAPGEQTTIELGYQSRGMDSWVYFFNSGLASIRDFDLTMTTNFSDVDYPEQTLLPTTEASVSSGWRLQWKYATLITSNGIGMRVPDPLQPGPLAERITFWAPVALLFYFFVLLMIGTLRKVDLHPINYFFLACAFFAFHLLFAYLVDRISIVDAFIICSLVSMLLTVTYLRLVVGWRFAAVESGLTQLIYLVLFSYALFNEGWSGLTITIGAIITLAVAMQLTGRVRWESKTM